MMTVAPATFARQQAQSVPTFDLSAQPADTVIPALARQGGIQILVDGAVVRGVRTSAVASSMMVRMRILRPSRVRPSMKSYAHTLPRYSGCSLMHEPSFSHSPPRFGCFCGTFNRSRRQIRSTHLWFTDQPAAIQQRSHPAR